MFSFLKSKESITTQELDTMNKAKMQLIDVRSPEEYRLGHIKEAKNVPLHTIKGFEGNKQEKVYVICQSGPRSMQAVRYLNSVGYEAVNVSGGMNQWVGKVQRGV